MARPRLDQPRYRLITRDGRFYVRWWQSGWHRVSARTTERVYAKHSPDYLRGAAAVLGGK